MDNPITTGKGIAILGFFVLTLVINQAIFAQPANDDCNTATEMTLYESEVSCIQIEGDTRGATASPEANVCSGSWFHDDIWFSFTTDDSIPAGGIIIKTSIGDKSTDVPATGMALYNSCSEDAIPMNCFTTAYSFDNELFGFAEWFHPNTTYYVRIWSGVSPTDDSGTFRICAFHGPIDSIPDEVVWDGGRFDGGISGWTTSSPIADSAVWYWTTEPTRGAWGPATISSPTYFNGWMAFDGDFLNTNGDQNQDLGIDWIAYLTSPVIDCSVFPAVKLKFYQNYRKWNSECYIEYSLDGGLTWPDPDADPPDPRRIEVNSEIGINDATPGISFIKLNLPELGGQPNVRFRFTYEGSYYYWLIDDVQLVRPACNDLKLKFAASAPYGNVPRYSASDFPLVAEIYNGGSCPQTGTTLNIQLVNDWNGEVIFETSKNFGTIPVDSLVTGYIFDELLTMPQMIGNYTLTYHLFSDSIDYYESDNVLSFPISVTGNEFSHDNGVTGMYSRNDLLIAAWMAGNIFHTNTRCLYTEVEFGIGDTEGLIGENIALLLYKWENSNLDDTIQIGERTHVGFNTYEISGNEPADGILKLPLFNITTGDIIDLEANTSYVILVQWNPSSIYSSLALQYDDRIDFRPANWATKEKGIHEYTTINTIWPQTGFLEAEDWEVGYGSSFNKSTVVPVIRLYGEPVIIDVKETTLDEDNLVKVFPNPVDDKMMIEMDFVTVPNDLRYEIYDLQGKLLASERIKNNGKGICKVTTKAFFPGTYQLKVISDLGVRVIPFVVQR